MCCFALQRQRWERLERLWIAQGYKSYALRLAGEAGQRYFCEPVVGASCGASPAVPGTPADASAEGVPGVETQEDASVADSTMDASRRCIPNNSFFVFLPLHDADKAPTGFMEPLVSSSNNGGDSRGNQSKYLHFI